MRRRDLERLQDRVPPFPQDVAIRVVEQDLGKPVSALFTSFSEPVAAASIAQVHKATVLDTDGTQRTLAVKVMRPGVRERFAQDLQAMRFMARIVNALLPDAERLRPREVVEILARSVTMEMDFRLEAAAMSELAQNTKGDADFRNVVNNGLMEGIESGKFFEIYERWFGPKGELPYPMSPQVRSFMLLQVIPK